MRKEIIEYLKSLKRVERSGKKLKEEVLEGKEFSLVDYSDVQGKMLIIRTPFISHLDLSDARIGEVILEGTFINIDVSGASIDMLDTRKADYVYLDDSEAKIKEWRRK